METAPFDTFFTGNEVGDDKGGALYATEYINAVNTVFDNNAARVDGGAAYAETNINVRHCLFESNQATGAMLYSCYGGAMRAEDTAIISNCTFNNNYAADYGGAVYAEIININNNMETAPFDTFFIGNEAGDDKGGALYAHDYINAVNTVFDNNAARVDGGAAYAETNINVRHCLFESNQATGAIKNICRGGAMRAEDTAIISNCTFNNNYAADYAGAVYAEIININNNMETALFDTFFTGNEAGDENGGALYAHDYINAVNTVFDNNTAFFDGGAAYAETNINVRHCLFEFNKATSPLISSYGGAMRAEDTAIIDNSTFISNFAYNKGGAVYAKDITIKGNSSIFEGNTAGDDGGAIYTDKFNGDVSRVSFIKNVAKKGDGGAIYINDEKWITFSQCIFSNNICEGRIFSKDTPEGRGGAIYLDSQSSHLTLKYNIFIFNRDTVKEKPYSTQVIMMKYLKITGQPILVKTMVN